MNVPTISQRVIDLSHQLQGVLKKINKLEKDNLSLSELLEDEMKQRQNVEKQLIKTKDDLVNEINRVRNCYGNMEAAINLHMEKVKQSIMDQLTERNNKFIKIFENQIDFGRNLEKNKVSKHPIRGDALINKSSIVPNNTINEDKIIKLEDMIKNEVLQIRKEINSNGLRTDYLEQRLKEIAGTVHNNIDSIYKDMTYVKTEMNTLSNAKNVATENFKNVQKDFVNNAEVIKGINSKIGVIESELNRKTSNYDDIIQSHTNNFEILKNDFQLKFKEIISNFNLKHQKFSETSLNEIDKQNREFDSFEKYLLEEHKKFCSYVQSCFDKQNDNIKKLIGYANDDIDLLKEKNETMESMMKKMKTELVQNINNSEAFLKNKYDSLFRLVNKV